MLNQAYADEKSSYIFGLAIESFSLMVFSGFHLIYIIFIFTLSDVFYLLLIGYVCSGSSVFA